MRENIKYLNSPAGHWLKNKLQVFRFEDFASTKLQADISIYKLYKFLNLPDFVDVNDSVIDQAQNSTEMPDFDDPETELVSSKLREQHRKSTKYLQKILKLAPKLDERRILAEWILEMDDFEHIQLVQDSCAMVMEQLGYLKLSESSYKAVRKNLQQQHLFPTFHHDWSHDKLKMDGEL